MLVQQLAGLGPIATHFNRALCVEQPGFKVVVSCDPPPPRKECRL